MNDPADARARARLHAIPWTSFRVCRASNPTDLAAAFRLVHDSYVQLGLCAPHPSKMRVSPQHLDPSTLVFVARRRGACSGAAPVVGTVSVIVDEHAGLPLASDYPEPVAAMRRRGARLCEIGALAVDPGFRRQGPNALLGMAALWAARSLCGATHCVIGVHPKSAGYYEGLYGFVPFGAPRRHCELLAPVAALIVDLSRLPGFLAAAHPEPTHGGRTVGEHVCGRRPGWVEPDGLVFAPRPTSPRSTSESEVIDERR